MIGEGGPTKLLGLPEEGTGVRQQRNRCHSVAQDNGLSTKRRQKMKDHRLSLRFGPSS